MNVDITMIITVLLRLVAIVACTLSIWGAKRYLLPWLESKMSVNELSALKEFIKTMIKAAEQLEKNGFFDDVQNVASAKKDYVLKAIKTQAEVWGFTFDEKAISDMIEGLIKEVKYPNLEESQNNK